MESKKIPSDKMAGYLSMINEQIRIAIINVSVGGFISADNHLKIAENFVTFFLEVNEDKKVELI